MNLRRFSLFLVLLVAAMACSLPSRATLSPTQAISSPSASILPHDLYFLSGSSGITQVWRLDAATLASTQLTAEDADITGFDVSPLDGSLAFVVHNQLVWVDSLGANRRVLVDGGPVDETSAAYQFHRKIAKPRWSPNGAVLAYARDGLSLYQFNTGLIANVLSNEVKTLSGGDLLPTRLYFPESWSPDGSRLLVSIGYYEGGSLGVLDPVTQNLVQFQGAVVCCQPAWTPDGAAVLVASPFINEYVDSGLWRYDAATGAAAVLIPNTSPDATLNFVSWPLQTPAGQLRYFFANTAAFPQEALPFSLVSASLDGLSGQTQLRSDAMLLTEALWSPDGSRVVIVQPPLGASAVPNGGAVILVYTDSRPDQPLAPNGHDLRWGR